MQFGASAACFWTLSCSGCFSHVVNESLQRETGERLDGPGLGALWFPDHGLKDLEAGLPAAFLGREKNNAIV